MRRTKYITSGGLAFSEEKDMEKLRRFSLKGWHVRDFKFMGYTLEKGGSSDYIYSVDYRSVKEDEEEEYFEFFLSSGWSHIASDGDIHLFRAHSGTKPIYSDRDTLVEKYKNLNGSMNYIAVPLVLLTVLTWVGTILSSGLLQSILQVIAVILSVVALPAAWTVIATYNNKWKAEEKKRLVNVMKMIPFLMLLIAAAILLLFDELDSAVRTLVYMVFGAAILPTAIWIVMSLYQNIGRNRAKK